MRLMRMTDDNHEQRDSYMYSYCNRTHQLECNACTVLLIEIVRIPYA